MTLTGNRIIDCALLSWFLAQLAKVVLDIILERKFVPSRFVSSGGMPSSHSALVVSCTTAVGKSVGIASPLFAVCVIVSAVVMYDACNVRRSAGDTAKIVNKLLQHVETLTAQDVADDLKIIMGHTPLQVLVGAVLGFLVGFFW